MRSSQMLHRRQQPALLLLLVLLGINLLAHVAHSFLLPSVARSRSSPILTRPSSPSLSSSAFSRQAASPWALSAQKQKTLAEELDDLRLDESAMSVEEKKKLQGLRASYKLEEVLDFDGKTGEVGFWVLGGKKGGKEGRETGWEGKISHFRAIFHLLSFLQNSTLPPTLLPSLPPSTLASACWCLLLRQRGRPGLRPSR